MARLLLHGFALAVVLAAAGTARAEQDPTEETIAAANEAGVDALDLQGAVNTTQLQPRVYLIAVGELAPPAPPAPFGWPFGGPLAQRIYCIEALESTHGLHMWNPAGWPPPYFNEHAQGWLGWLPSTARRWGVQIGNRASEWDGAARMLLAGAGNQFYGVAAGRC